MISQSALQIFWPIYGELYFDVDDLLQARQARLELLDAHQDASFGLYRTRALSLDSAAVVSIKNVANSAYQAATVMIVVIHER